MTKPVLMIHEFREEFFSLPLERYVLTFDDGLYSQFYYWPALQMVQTEKIFFVSSGIICDTHQSTNFMVCEDAHKQARLGDFSQYMTEEQITELMADPLVTIGGHSHTHTRLAGMTLTEKVHHMTSDTKQMLSWFDSTLRFRPTSFCYPYNDDISKMYPAVLKRFGFEKFYGKERIPIETLLTKKGL